MFTKEDIKYINRRLKLYCSQEKSIVYHGCGIVPLKTTKYTTRPIPMSNLIIEFLRIECTISILVHDMHCTKRERHQICEGVKKIFREGFKKFSGSYLDLKRLMEDVLFTGTILISLLHPALSLT